MLPIAKSIGFQKRIVRISAQPQIAAHLQADKIWLKSKIAVSNTGISASILFFCSTLSFLFTFYLQI
jgi:hypothetical protein